MYLHTPQSVGNGRNIPAMFALLFVLSSSFIFAVWGQDATPIPCVKSAGVLYPSSITAKAKANVAAYPWAATMQKEIVDGAAPWLAMSDEDLWSLVFGATISRSWMVWSDGFCPACRKDVKMYTWIMDPWGNPWKTQCPHCKELFPKNDFGAFYRSGLDEHGIFQPAKANRSLLFNAEHPDPNDPLHAFGVDDGEGYVDGEGHLWRFIGAYLIYAQWKKMIIAGVTAMSNACTVTGDPVYARKTAILLDRIADIFPTYDFSKQGSVYEGRTGGAVRGQVSTWHDACREMHELILAYDRIFELAKEQEPELTAFLSKKAEQHRIENGKKTWADIQRNIEERIFRETLAHRERIESNYPTTDHTILAIKAVLDWPQNRDEVMGILDGILEKAMAVDGVSGEKGLAGYSTIAPRTVSEILGEFSRIDQQFLRQVYERNPRLRDCFRFHIDTWFDVKYYPHCGDSGGFGVQFPAYGGVTFAANPGTGPSMYEFMWELYSLTGDAAFVQVLFHANGDRTEALPHDIFEDDPSAFQSRVKDVIDKEGIIIRPASVNKQEWRLALLRSGSGENQRMLWIDYDSGERHSHADGMNIGLFAKGLDLIPEFGYPPVGYGGWESQKARWYTKTAAHVTVVVDGSDQKRINSGVTTLWADGKRFRAIRCSDPAMTGGSRYERTVALVDLDDKDSYVIDAFIVSGGKDHAKFFHSFFGSVETQGLTLDKSDDYGHETEMRDFRRDAKPSPSWFADWKIEDRYKYFQEPKNIHVRYTDLTADASAWLTEGWIDIQQYGGNGGTYIPRVMTRRTSPDANALTSAFVDIIEPYENEPNLGTPKRIALAGPDETPSPETAIGIEIPRRDGRRDLCIIADTTVVEDASSPENTFRVQGALGFVTSGQNGPERIVLCKGTRLEIADLVLTAKQKSGCLEVVIDGTKAAVVSGDPAKIESLSRGGERMEVTAR